MALKDPSKAVLQAAYNVLNNNVTVGDVTYPVYTFVPSEVDGGYIYCQDVEVLEASTKDRFMQSCSLTIQIVMPILGVSGSRATIEDITTKVLELMKTSVTSDIDLGSDFNCVLLYVRSVRNFNDGPLEEGRYLRKIIDIAIEIEQL